MTIPWIRTPDVVWEELDGEALIVSPSTGRGWTLNASAAHIWKLCDGGLHPSAVAKRCSEVSQKEIANFCQLFAELGLLKLSGQTFPDAMSATYAAYQSGSSLPPLFTEFTLASGVRRRPTPRGNSGPG